MRSTLCVLIKNSEPDAVYIKEKLSAIMASNNDYQVYITQGFICKNAYGEVDNLQRGGSDYTASLVGAAINCRRDTNMDWYRWNA